MKAFTIPSIYSAIDKFTAPVRKMMGAHQSFANSMDSGVARGERLFRKFTPALSETTKQMFSFASAAALAAAVIAGISFTFAQIKEFDKSLASLRSITGQTTKEFAPLRQKILEVAIDSKKSAVEVVEAFNKIASLNAKFLESAEAIGVVSKATITLSKASGDELGPSAENLIGIMNQFSLGADQAERTINVLAAGAGVGAASIVQAAESYKNFGSVAAAANITLEESTALIQTLGKFSVFGAEAGTKLRGSVLKLQQAGVGYASGQFNINDALTEARAKIDKLSTAKQKDAALTKMFGAENISTGSTLLSNIELYKEFTKGVTGTSAAYEQAAINSDTLAVASQEVMAAWTNLILSSSKTSTALDGVKKVLQFVSSNMESIVSIGMKILAFFLAWKVVLIATRAILIGYNVVLGITGALSSTASVAIGSNAVALGAYKFALWIATAAQWAFNFAMTANPIGIVIVAIAALIGYIALVIIKWNEWGAAMSMTLGPLGAVISLVQSFRRNWDMITDSFSGDGFIGGLKAIGKVLIDSLLQPILQITELLAKVTGSKNLENAVKGITLARKALGVNVTTDETGDPIATKEAINPEARKQEALTEKLESVKTFNSRLLIEDRTGKAKLDNENPFIGFKVSSTLQPSF